MPIFPASFEPKRGVTRFRHQQRFPALMGDFAAWLGPAASTPETAFEAHRRLVDILNDGNGRTARLVMNLILIRGGYPPIAVRPEDRLEYIRSLQQEQAGQGAGNFDSLLYRRLDATLGEYLSAFEEAEAQS
jgi:Fic family protein